MGFPPPCYWQPRTTHAKASTAAILASPVDLAPQGEVRHQAITAGAPGGSPVARFLRQLGSDERGQDIAEYAVMLAVILVIVVGTVRLIGSNANTVFSSVGSSIQ
jgi:Flp pilus assembly pilin Flp